MQRRRRSWQLSPVAVAVSGAATAAPLPNGDWLGFGRTSENNRHSPLTEITPDERGAARPRLHGRLQEDRPGYQDRRAVVSGRRRRPALRHDERRQRLPHRRGDGQGRVAVQAERQRRLQELRHRREPRPRLLRRQALPAHARHAHQLAEPGRRAPDQARHDRARRARRGLELRLFRDERPDLREPSRRLRRRGLRVRHARLRDGLHDGPHAGLAEPVLDDPARAAELAGCEPHRRRRQRLDSRHGRRRDRHRVLRHRLGDAALLPVRAPGPEPAHRLADRRRPEDRQDEVVAAADLGQPVVVRRRAAAARVRRQGRRQDAAHRLGRHDGRRLVRLRRGLPASRSTSASR